MNTQQKESIVIYQAEDGDVEFRADIEKDTMWATQDQIANLFQVSVPNINIHLKNIFKSSELDEDSVIKESLITAKDSKQYLTKSYNLDAVIAVGYRVNSKKATQFRIWATGILHKFLVDGHALNKRRLASAPEKLLGLYDAVAFLESKSLNGKLRGKITLKLTEELEPTGK